MSPEPRPPDQPVAGDASRRTYLATERTFLAWFRSGLASVALAITIGRVVPELIQSEATAGRMAEEVVGILGEPGRAERMRSALRAVKDGLGGRGASARAARALLEAAGLDASPDQEARP